MDSYNENLRNERLLEELTAVHQELDDGNQNLENLNDSIEALNTIMATNAQYQQNSGPRYSNMPEETENNNNQTTNENTGTESRTESKGTSIEESMATQERLKREELVDIASTRLEERHDEIISLEVQQIDLLKKMLDNDHELSEELSRRSVGTNNNALTDATMGGMMAKFLSSPQTIGFFKKAMVLGLKGGAVAAVGLGSYFLTKEILKANGYYEWIEKNMDEWMTSEESKKRESERNLKLQQRTNLNKTLKSDIDQLSEQTGLSQQQINDGVANLQKMSEDERNKFMEQISKGDQGLVKTVLKNRSKYIKSIEDVSKMDMAQLKEEAGSIFSSRMKNSKDIEKLISKGYAFDTKQQKWVKIQDKASGGRRTKGFTKLYTSVDSDERDSRFLKDATMIANAELQAEVRRKYKKHAENNKTILDFVGRNKLKEKEEIEAKVKTAPVTLTTKENTSNEKMMEVEKFNEAVDKMPSSLTVNVSLDQDPLNEMLEGIRTGLDNNRPVNNTMSTGNITQYPHQD